MTTSQANSLSSIAYDRRRVLIGAGTVAGVLATGMVSLKSSPALAAPQAGQAAPDFSVVDTRGVTRSLADLRGKVVVMEWTNHDCPFVKKHYGAGNMQALQKEATDAGVVWLSVVSSAKGEQGFVSAVEANKLTESRNASPTGVLLDPDGKIGRSYGAMTTPHMYVIDKDGVLRYAGGIDSIASTKADDIKKAEPYFREALLAVNRGEPVKNATTRPYGCSVKYVG